MADLDPVHWINETGIIAIIRGSQPDTIIRTAEALYEGGIRAMEVTFNTPGVLQMIESLNAHPIGRQMAIGAGTVLDVMAARTVIAAGARFLVTPNLDEAVVQLGQLHGVPVVPGVFTATEIVKAWRLGASFVKIFPAGSAGPQYLKELQGPLSHVKLVPVGGVSLDNVREFIRAGAAAVGVGGELIDREAVARGRFDRVTATAAAFIQAIRESRLPGAH
ncbi:2-dehydro-3-deoxyphosphogluconate aldolase/(4S)-4-hydroxy-2-oxoglutarate aldolase [Hydrogenispora ethanolica]|uniref:2-dehydro-3-deoxyphosphogluconate aldolase/(4S)-4-hydroxy-2-oxoglutarate aldolase n=1 Tax=Hydrogenispora ethanolica TaxID=1082276 RepID=A0A4V2QGK7_HYDET|nr:bifunctional 4-hydroxy-2-oxoglutarate aldolase/2-dehydro-3-deoxy-phosphogluconate aldolase [Hydrogenispora ethanolica]TCL76267.1 2-dehydro-3-deoxyphosphogluconate aldolase/(4S)-4-hydroxy-2-oxoglutarate aldolase [Hydrogenispora ethanolica]